MDVKCRHLDLFHSLLERKSFVMVLNEVFTCGSEPVVMAKVFELLTAILLKPTLRPMIKSAMTAPISMALSWLGRTVEVTWKAPTQAVHFLCELLDDGCSTVLPDHFGEIVNTIKEELELKIDADDYVLDVNLSKKLSFLLLMNLLCVNNAFVAFVKDNLKLDYGIAKLQSMLADFCDMSSPSLSFSAAFGNCWNLKVSVLLQTVQFLLQVNRDDAELQKCMLEVFADPHMMQVQCLGLLSTSEKDINLAMQLINEASNYYSTFQCQCLAKYVTARNCEKRSWSSVSLETKMPVFQPLINNNLAVSNDSGNASGGEVLKIAGLKPSQVIDFYEKKSSSYEARLKTMESLLKRNTDFMQELDDSTSGLWLHCHSEVIWELE